MKHTKTRYKLIEDIDANWIELVKKLEGRLYRLLFNELSKELDFDGNKIKVNNSNLATVTKITQIAENYQKKHLRSAMLWMAKQYIKVLNINKQYFRDNLDFKIKEINNTSKRVNSQMLQAMGVTVRKVKRNDKIINRVSVKSGSLLSNMYNINDIYTKVQQSALNAIQQGASRDEFRRIIRDEVVGKKQIGALQRHFIDTKVVDTFAEFDRTVQKDYATRLDLTVFVYRGGKIDASRSFCVERDGKVFTDEEAEQWKTFDWAGKYPKGNSYDPVKHMGGARCRHYRNYIGKIRALSLRPDLEDYFNKKAA